MNRALIAAVALIGLTGLTGCIGPWSLTGGARPTHHYGPTGPPMSSPGGCCPMPPGPNDATTLSGGGTLTTNANDAFIAYGSFQISGTESTVQVPLPFTGTVTKLRVFVTTAPGAGNDWVLTVRKNETNTALTCTIAGAFTTCNDNSVVSITAGDLLDLRVSPTSSPALTTISWSATITP